MATPAELPPVPPGIGESIWYVVYLVGAGAAWFLTRAGLNRKPDQTPMATVSAALMDNRVVDPLAAALRELTEIIKQDIALRSQEREEAERKHERDAIADDVFGQIRKMLEDMPPAEMPKIRKPPTRA